MHEVAIAQALVDLVIEQARAIRARRVTKVLVRIGELSGIVDSALVTAIEACSSGTLAEGMSVACDRVAWTAQCRGCECIFNVIDRFPQCPACGHLGGKTVSGQELQFVEMEIE